MSFWDELHRSDERLRNMEETIRLLDVDYQIKYRLTSVVAGICAQSVDRCILLGHIERAEEYACLGELYASYAIESRAFAPSDDRPIRRHGVLGTMYYYLHGFRWMLEGKEDESLLRIAVHHYQSEIQATGRRLSRAQSAYGPELANEIDEVLRITSGKKYTAMALVHAAVSAGEFELADKYMRKLVPMRPTRLSMEMFAWSESRRLWRLIVESLCCPDDRKLRSEIVSRVTHLFEVWCRGADEELMQGLVLGDAIQLSYVTGKYFDELRVSPFTRVNVVNRLRWRDGTVQSGA